MKATKRILMTLLTLVGISTGAWALDIDGDGYYLIANADDWDAFATVVQSTPTANAKLIADIATVTTMLGSESKEFAGVFDGKGHTLTVNISGSSKFVAPFHYVKGGTIKNLRVEGTVTSTNIHMSGLIGRAYDEVSIENCVVATNIQMYDDYAGGFVGNGGSKTYGGPSKVVMRNCVFIGSFTGVNGTRDKVSAFWGWGMSTPVFINCLENGSYTNISGFNPFMFEGTEKQNTETTANSYYMHGSITLEGVSDASSMSKEDLVNLLGDDWELDPVTNEPILKIFVQGNAISTGIDSGQRSKGIGQREGWYTIDGRKLSGKPAKKGVYINNGQKTVVQ